IAWDDDSGGILDARLKLDAIDEGVYRIRATSPSGGGTGTYTLYFWSRTPDGGPGSEAPLVALGNYDATISGQGPSDREPVTLVVCELPAADASAYGDVRTFVVNLPIAGGTWDVWLFAQTAFGLYGIVDTAIEGWIDAVCASGQIEGYEHIRVASVQGGEQL